MRGLRFDGHGSPPVPITDNVERPTEGGYLWLDFVRDEDENWAERVAETVGLQMFEAHVTDSLNADHPSYADITDLYEMLIFRGLVGDETRVTTTRPTALFLAPGLLITVRHRDAVSPRALHERLITGRTRIPRRPIGLFHALLSAMVDRYLAHRAPLSEDIEDRQRRLLDESDPFNDWQELMLQRVQVRRLETACEEQLEAIEAWREGTNFEIDQSLEIRFNDLVEHIGRVSGHAQQVQHEVEAVVQIHFSALAHRTNEIMRVLTVMAGVFMPLTFIAGIFGMNFDHMPELHTRYGYFIALAVMGLIAVLLLWYFRRRRWL
ncbi:MAG: magnesium transporter CorA family protein [Planctomycetes bacterium]|nr:magnesium transporter CorA family protein [Planctomycetota bacterium]